MSGIRTELRRRAQERAQGAPVFRRLQVRRNVSIAPRFRRVTVAGDDLVGFPGGALPADAVKLFLPVPGQRSPVLPSVGPDGLRYPEGATPPNVRAYTVRRHDPDALELDLDVLLHDGSPGSVWASTARRGDEIGLAGPRHDFYASPDADWHLLVGDDTAVPAIAAILESLPDGTTARALVEVEGPDDELPLRTRPGVSVRWLHRAGRPAGETDLLEYAVRRLDWPTGTPQAWVAAEAGIARGVRRYLRERGLPSETTHVSGYWRRGLTNADLDQLTWRRYQRAQAAGQEVDDLEPEGDYAA